MTTAYYSRELSYLLEAQTSLQTALACRPGTCVDDMVTAANVVKCATAASDPLLKFQSAWSNQTTSYNSRAYFNKSMRVILGDLDVSSSATVVGVIPALVILGIVFGMGYVVYKCLNRYGILLKKGQEAGPGVAKDWQHTTIKICGLFILILTLLPISWTFGISARYQGYALVASLKNDSAGDEGGFKVYNNADFSKIWNACTTTSLQQIYNCAQGNDVTCVAGKPAAMNSDSATLQSGLSKLATVNLLDFDAVAIIQRINADINSLLSILAPMSASRQSMSAADVDFKITAEILPLLQVPGAVPSSASSEEQGRAFETFKAAANSSDPAENVTGKIAVVIEKYWPQLDPAKSITKIDDVLKAYYDRGTFGTSTSFYTTYVRDYVLAIFQSARQQVATSLSGDPRFASIQEFTQKIWPNIMSAAAVTTTGTSVSAIKSLTADLYTNITRYTSTFVPNRQPAHSMSADLTTMWINCALGIIFFFLVIFLVYVITISQADTLKDAMGASETGFTNKVIGSGSAWYSRMDITKYVMMGIGVAMLTMSILVVMKRKVTSKADHNNNALYYNSTVLKSASWNLLLSVYPINCVNAAGYKTSDPTAYTACVKRFPNGLPTTSSDYISASITAAGAATTDANDKATALTAYRTKLAASDAAAAASTAANAAAASDPTNVALKTAVTDATNKATSTLALTATAKTAYDAATVKADASALASTSLASDFYKSALKVILAYEQCNLVTQNNKVPFPTAEFVILALFMFICVAGLVYLTGMTQPKGKVDDIRYYLRIRERLTMISSGQLPESIRTPLESRMGCGDAGADVLRILSFSFVVLLFILNAVLVSTFKQSADAYQTSLNTVSANMCI